MTHPEILLKQVPLFRSLRVEDSRHIAALLQKQTLRKGDVLFRNGEEGHSLYMIAAGKIKIIRQSRTGTRSSWRFFPPAISAARCPCSTA